MSPRWPAELVRIVQAQNQRATKPLTKLRTPYSAPIGQYTGRAQTPIPNGYGTGIVQATVPVITVVSATSGTASGTGAVGLTLAIPATVAGHTLIAKVSVSSTATNGTVGSITLGGLAGNWTQRDSLAGTEAFMACWEDASCAGGQTNVTITTSGGTGTLIVNATVYEVAGLIASGAFDQTANSGNATSSTSFTSTATPALGQLNEIAFGMVTINAADTLTGPTSPWVNQAQINGASNTRSLTGYNIVSTNTGLAYAGTISVAAAYNAMISTFKAAAVTTSTTVSVGPQGLGTIWYPVLAAVGTTTGANDPSTVQLYSGPLSQLQLISGTSYAGGGDSIGLGGNPLSPGYFIVAVWSGAKVGDTCSLAVYGTQDALIRPAN